MQFRLQHKTTYRYEEEVTLGPHVVRLCPAAHVRADIKTYSLKVEPQGQLRWHFDPWNNKLAKVAFAPTLRTRSLSFLVDATIETEPFNPFDFFIDDRCESLPFNYPDGLEIELEPFLAKPNVCEAVSQFQQSTPAAGPVIDYLVAINQAVSKRISYTTREEPGIQTSEETMERGSGSCRDMAALLLDCLRSAGLAARFVSGYLLQPGSSAGTTESVHEGGEHWSIESRTNLVRHSSARTSATEDVLIESCNSLATAVARETRTTNADGSVVREDGLALHAWVEVYIPGAGWIGLDSTSGLLCGEGHIPLAATVTPVEAAPITGTASGTATSFEVIASAV
ncbi:MAG: transglutaminase family protein, partial [Cyanobacteria bacterium]|nr:transglutaminase family protein [Cyanobacteriota bacterium]